MHKSGQFQEARQMPGLVEYIYRILGNFQGKIFSLFSRICLQPRNFNYACSIIINDN